MKKGLEMKLYSSKYVHQYDDGMGEISYWVIVGYIPVLDDHGYTTVKHSKNKFMYRKVQKIFFGLYCTG